MNKLQLTAVAALIIAIATPTLVNAHCQVPCGIYNDDARFVAMLEDATTIEKAMVSIRKIDSSKKHRDGNQLVRWVDTKEVHADKLTETVTAYFLTQRIKPVDSNKKAAHATYLKKLELLHNIMIQAMKCKQTTDADHVTKIRGLIAEFKTLYNAK
ncbi:MAG: superoxide dismutase [Kiritimatiellae bacterium]|nr:superoxide dismutase [Kiritimatiellia bacterium]